jgi:hypothetical protein
MPKRRIAEVAAHLLEVGVTGHALRHRVDAFRPVERGAFAVAEEAVAFAPAGHGVDVAGIRSLPEEFGPVHVDAEGASIDLGDAQVHQLP